MTHQISSHNVTSAEQTNTLGEQQTSDILHQLGEVVYQWNLYTDELVWSDDAANILGLSTQALPNRGRAFDRLLVPTSENSRANVIHSAKTDGSAETIRPSGSIPYSLQYAFDPKSTGTEKEVWVEDTGRWTPDQNGKPAHAVGIMRVIEDKRRLQERLDYMARFDPLTGLHNRSHLDNCLESTFANLRDNGGTAGFLLVSIEHFDLINTVYGHLAGDSVIIEVAHRLRLHSRDKDIIGRFSGARIGILLDDCNERDMLIAGYRILNVLRDEVVQTDSGPIAINAAVGSVVIPQHASNAKEAFSAAYNALLDSQKQHEATIVSYRPDPAEESRHREAVKLSEKIIQALKQGRIHLAFQPVVDATSRELEFFEALIRLEDEEGMVLVAGDFISVAIRLGLIRLLDHHALDLVLQALNAYPNARLSLNVSNETANDPEWLSKLAIGALARPDITERLIIEITESHVAESLDEARRFITSLHDLGFKVAIDDFGAGYTSFRNLKTLNYDIIKIDGEFARDLERNPENQAFIKALIDLARMFDARTVVEWVEETQSADQLRDWGVDLLQGYLFGKPLREPHWPSQLTYEVEPSLPIAAIG